MRVIGQNSHKDKSQGIIKSINAIKYPLTELYFLYPNVEQIQL